MGNTEKEKILMNERLINVLSKTHTIDKEELSKLLESRKSSIIATCSCLGIGALSIAVGSGMMLSNESYQSLLSFYIIFISAVSLSNAAVPFTNVVMSKKQANAVIERLAAEEDEIKKLEYLNEILKNNINKDVEKESTNEMLNTVNTKEELENLKKYLEIISYYGSNRDKMISLYENHLLPEYLSKKGFDLDSIEYILYYIKQQRDIAYDKNMLYTNIFEKKAYALKKSID